MDNQNETEEKKTRKGNLLEELGGQLIDGACKLFCVSSIFYK